MKPILFVVAASMLLGAAGPVPPAYPRQDDAGVPLREQLEGLDPGPRIAYLRYLIEGGRGDAEVFFYLGLAFHESDEPDSALHYYRRATEVSPDFFKAYVNMGVLYDDRGRLGDAVKMYESAIAANREDVLAHAHVAYVLYRLKNYGRAWEYLERALAIDPDHPQPHFYLAIFFWDSGMLREALAEWERVIELEPDGMLADRAREHIVLLRRAFTEPPRSGETTPQR